MRVLASLIAALTLSSAVSAEPASVRCQGTRGDVLAATDAEQRLICSAAVAVEAFLSTCGLHPVETYRVAVHGDIKGYYGQSLLGRFQPSLRQSQIVPLAQIGALAYSTEPGTPPSPYRALPLDELYRSVAAHEIAHAITQQHLKHPPNLLVQNLLVHEYVSAVVQISLLPEPVRETYLAQFKELKDVGDDILNDMVLAMDPARFGVAAFHHFHRPGNGCAFLAAIVQVKATFPRQWP